MSPTCRSHAPILTATILWFAIAASARARAQCSEWSPAFHTVGVGGYGANDDVRSQFVYDDGSGPKLYVAGYFGTAGGLYAPSVARWDGAHWSGLGPTVDSYAVWTMTSFDDGSGPSLIAGGGFSSMNGTPASRVARWDGTSWHALGLGIEQGAPFTMCSFDDGSGPALYVGGQFGTAGGMPAQSIARWDGTSWSQVGAGLNSEVRALAVHDDGSGPALYAGGMFQVSGGVLCLGLARWDGTAWGPVGGGVIHGGNGAVNALASWDDGTGRKLYVAGQFSSVNMNTVPAANIASFDGSAWSALGSGTVGNVLALAVYDDGAQERLCVAGKFATAGGLAVGSIAAWDGSAWSQLGGGPLLTGASDEIKSLAVFEDGGGPKLHAAGRFEIAGARVFNDVASWDGDSWDTVGVESLAQGFDTGLNALGVWDDGGGPDLYAAGAFAQAGPTVAHKIARWNGTGWDALGTSSLPTSPIISLAGSNVGGVPALYAAQVSVKRFDGASWSTLPLLGGVSDLIAFDDGGGERLFAGGSFNFTDGGQHYSAIAAWDGVSWSEVGGGVGGGVNAFAVYDDGSGPALYAGGAFLGAGQSSANFIARWDGTSWSALGAGINGSVHALAVHDDGSGPALYVGGAFTIAGGVSAPAVARWDGASWSAVGTGFFGLPLSLASFDDGSGPHLYCGGDFSSVGGVPNAKLGKWDGSVWSAVGGGLGPISAEVVRALQPFSDGFGGAALWVGGSFTSLGGGLSSHIAQWRACSPPPVAFCSGDGSVAACPCGNSGVAGHGCENSASTGGALLSASGTTRPDTLVLSSAGELPSALSIFSQGDALLGSAVSFGDGLRCVGGALKRLYATNAVGGVASAPAPGATSITERSAALGDPIVPGSTRFYYVYYRDPNLGFCPSGGAFNASSSLEVVW